MISGVGIDLVRIERIARWIDRPGLIERFFHPEEIEAATSRGAGKAASLAARFAAKEAFGKALGTGLSGLELREVCVHNDERGQPFVTLHGASAVLFAARGGGNVHCSLSHEKDYAIALVVIEAVAPLAGSASSANVLSGNVLSANVASKNVANSLRGPEKRE